MTLVSVGVVQKPHGIRGELKVFLKTDSVNERFKKGNSLIFRLNGKEETVVVESSRMHKGSLLLKLVGLDSLNDVEFYHSGEFFVEKETRHALPEDEYYFSDLVGCDAYDNDQLLGPVIEMIDNPAHPIMRIKAKERDILVPFNKAFVASVDLDKKHIAVNWMEGL